MKIELRNNVDFLAGLLMIGVGAVAFYMALDYPFGSALRMGPGFFPTMLGGILAVFGIYVMARGLRRPEAIQGRWSLRALVILPLSLVLFGILMERAGFIPALVGLIFGSAAAGREFKLVEVLLLTLLLSGLSVAVFIWGLGLPYPLVKGF